MILIPQLICLSKIRNIAHFINLFDPLTSLNKSHVLLSHQLYFCSSNTSRNGMSKCCSITLTELPKKGGHPVLTGIFLSHLLSQIVWFSPVTLKVDVFVITINIYHLKTNTSYNHKSKYLTITSRNCLICLKSTECTITTFQPHPLKNNTFL